MRTLAPDATEGPRALFLHLLAENPALHLRSIERRSGLPLGQVLYHLGRLERMGLVSSIRENGFRRFFVTDRVSREEKPVLSALRHDVPRLLILTLLERGPAMHRDLQAAAGVAGSTLTFHLQRLVASGVVQRERHEGVILYAVTAPALVERELVAYRASFDDPRVDRFVDERTRRFDPPPDLEVAPLSS